MPWTPSEFRLLNVVRPGDPILSLGSEAHDLDYGSYGLDQCLDGVRTVLARGNGAAPPDGDDWLIGQGVALAMIACTPPTEHRTEARLSLEADGRYHLAIGSPEFGNGSTTVRHQLVATVLGTGLSSVVSIQGDTARTGYDTGPFGSAGTTVAAKAVEQAAQALRDHLLDFAARQAGVARERLPARRGRRDLQWPTGRAGRAARVGNAVGDLVEGHA